MKTYVWPVGQPDPVFATRFAAADVYEKALASFIMVCADVVPYHAPSQTLLLAKRAQKPMEHLWFYGGRVWIGERVTEAALRHFAEDTGLRLTADRLQPLGVMDYLFHERQQAPQNTPCHTHAHTFAVALTEAEITQWGGHVRAPEYLPGSLTRVTRAMAHAHPHPAVRDVYEALFPLA